MRGKAKYLRPAVKTRTWTGEFFQVPHSRSGKTRHITLSEAATAPFGACQEGKPHGPCRGEPGTSHSQTPLSSGTGCCWNLASRTSASPTRSRKCRATLTRVRPCVTHIWSNIYLLEVYGRGKKKRRSLSPPSDALTRRSRRGGGKKLEFSGNRDNKMATAKKKLATNRVWS